MDGSSFSLSDLSVSRGADGGLRVSTWLTQGVVATVWFDLDRRPHVMWEIFPLYRQGITEDQVLAAVEAYLARS